MAKSSGGANAPTRAGGRKGSEGGGSSDRIATAFAVASSFGNKGFTKEQFLDTYKRTLEKQGFSSDYVADALRVLAEKYSARNGGFNGYSFTTLGTGRQGMMYAIKKNKQR